MQATSRRDFRAIASAALAACRPLILIALAILLILVFLPAALVGAAT